MSTDSTELTFVRCPSCRSLVPAVSTRCRMCGAGIDAQGKESSGGEAPAPKRTRQNTVTQPPTEFVQVVESAKASAVEEGFGNQQEEFDPLRDYLDDSASSEAVVSAPEAPKVAQEQSSPSPFIKAESASQSLGDDDDDFDIFADDDDNWLDEIDADPPVVKEETVVEPVVAPILEQKIEEPAPIAVREVDTRPREETRRPESSATKPAPTNREQPRVVVESGPRQGGKPSAFSFSKGKADEGVKRGAQEPNRETPKNETNGGNAFARQPQSQQQQQAKPRDNRPAEREQQRQDRPRQEQRNAPIPAPMAKREEPPVGKQHQGGDRQGRDRHEQRPDRQEHQPAPQRNSPQREQRPKGPAYEGVESRLVGWLVSFSTPTRTSYELREGKFFISGSSLKPNDLVLKDASIATPHAIVAVESGRLQVQDLMSESGVFRRRARESDFAAFGEPFELRHGDWVRFGNVDFLVTMIPSDHE